MVKKLIILWAITPILFATGLWPIGLILLVFNTCYTIYTIVKATDKNKENAENKK